MSGEIVVDSSRGSPSTWASTARVEALEEARRRRLLDEQARARHAVLAGVVVLERGLLRGRVEVGVGEDEERALAAQLGRERDEILRGRRRHEPARIGGAGEAHAAQAAVRDERRSGLLADALDDVEDAGRELGLLRRGRRGASRRAAPTRAA